MKPRTKQILIVLVALLLPLWAFGSPVYFAKSISGQVFDDETGAPLIEVIFVAQSSLFQDGIGHNGHTDDTANIIEVVTDRNCRYFISG